MINYSKGFFKDMFSLFIINSKLNLEVIYPPGYIVKHG